MCEAFKACFESDGIWSVSGSAREGDVRSVEALEAGAQHRFVDLLKQPFGGVYHPSGVDAEQVATNARWWIAQSARPLTTAATPAGSVSGTMRAAWTSARSRSVQIAQRCW